ncbi:MAG: hypothetical protein ABSB71_07145 [Candidatus Bathyarchaeia archaeon]
MSKLDETCAGDDFSVFSREIITGIALARSSDWSPTFQSASGVASAVQ